MWLPNSAIFEKALDLPRWRKTHPEKSKRFFFSAGRFNSQGRIFTSYLTDAGFILSCVTSERVLWISDTTKANWGCFLFKFSAEMFSVALKETAEHLQPRHRGPTEAHLVPRFFKNVSEREDTPCSTLLFFTSSLGNVSTWKSLCVCSQG